MRVAPWVLVLAAGVSWGETVQQGGWTQRAVNGVFLAFPTESRDLLSLACLTDDSEAPPLYGKSPATGSEWVEVTDTTDALEMLDTVWRMEAAGLPGSELTAFTFLTFCFDERDWRRQVIAWQRAKAQAAPPPQPEPYIRPEEIEAHFQPFRDRMAATQAVLDEMAQDALDDYRAARRARGRAYRGEDDGYPLEPITLPHYDDEPIE
ncbi:MAG: hypothetical protein OXG82_19590 [Gammaproteobacteria bacterium]|nr:hypothetical protein [Gammaproteobacteria bacterium]